MVKKYFYFVLFLSLINCSLNPNSKFWTKEKKILVDKSSEIVSIVKIDGVSESKNYDLGTKIAMHIAASNPLAIDKNGIDKKIIDKELEIIQAEITNSGKPKEMAEKIAKGKLSKFLNDNSLLSQIWILDPKKKVEDVLKENSSNKQIKIVDFVKFKVGEGV